MMSTTLWKAGKYDVALNKYVDLTTIKPSVWGFFTDLERNEKQASGS
jgi:hypothetical protein